MYAVFRYKSKYKKIGVLPIWKVRSNVSSVGPSSERNMKEHFSLTIKIKIQKGWCTADIWKVKSNVSSVGPSSESNRK